MSANLELTPAVLAELRTALLLRQAALQRRMSDLRRNERVSMDPPVTSSDNATGKRA